jgi:DNA-binding transcriptional ArsR family regulator
MPGCELTVMPDNYLSSEEERLEWIDAWADYVASAPDKEWGMIHKVMTKDERELRERVNEFLEGDKHKILQMILGHPARLPTVEELSYFVGIDESTVESHLGVLLGAGIVNAYRTEAHSVRGVSSTFYGLTPTGVRVLDELDYLDGMPVMRALHDKTRKTDRIQKLEATPRPPLPDVVHSALVFEDDAVSLR